MSTNKNKNKKWNGSKWIRPEKRARVYKRDNHTCIYCECSIYDSVIILTLDHVTARELGGGNEATNLVTACKSCNSAKRDLSVRAFALYLADQGMDIGDVAKRIKNATRRKLPR